MKGGPPAGEQGSRKTGLGLWREVGWESRCGNCIVCRGLLKPRHLTCGILVFSRDLGSVRSQAYVSLSP